MRQLNFNKALLIGFLSCGLMACEAEQTEKDIIAEAQFCLNKARGPAAVDSCMAPLEGLTSFYAYELKCAAGFAKADITSPANLSKALTAISGESPSSTVMLAALTFPSADSRGESLDINTTFNDCIRSGRPGLKLIAAMARSATKLNTLTGGNCAGADLDCIEPEIATSIEEITKALTNNSSTVMTPTEAEEKVTVIIESIQTVYQTTCSGTYNANSDICSKINSAATEAGVTDFMSQDPGDIVALGLELLKQWQTN